MGIIQSVVPFAAAPTFGLIYRSTVDTLPQAYLCVVAALLVVDIVIMVVIDRGFKRILEGKKKEEEEEKGDAADQGSITDT